MTTTTHAPPRDEIFRAVRLGGVELRDDGDGGAVMAGHFAVFNRWTEIDSLWEGRFLERIAPGAFRKTFREQRKEMRVLFQHGFDPQVGDKPLGPIDVLKEDRDGAYYEVPLLEARYVQDDVLPGLRAGLYGASFRFRVIREEFVEEPEASEENPRALPERTLKEVSVREFGPVTFPAYQDATAGVRSATDDVFLGRLAHDPEKARRLMEALNQGTASGAGGVFFPARTEPAAAAEGSAGRLPDPLPEGERTDDGDPVPAPIDRDDAEGDHYEIPTGDGMYAMIPRDALRAFVADHPELFPNDDDHRDDAPPDEAPVAAGGGETEEREASGAGRKPTPRTPLYTGKERASWRL